MATGAALSRAIHRVVEPVEGMHQSISARWFNRVEPIAKPVRLMHDGISRLVYSSIRIGSAGAGAVLDARTSVESDKAMAFEALVNGLWGDTTTDRELRLRTTGGDTLDARDSAPGTGRIVVLVHGLVETERRWSGTPERPGFTERLAERPDLTPVTVRYNTGMAVADSGALLADALEGMCEEWPVPIESIAVIGHSMGGLVASAAFSAAEEAGHEWPAHATDLISIGAPHAGAPLERFVGAVASGLGRVNTTRPLAKFIEGRSRGIKDLRRPPAGRVPTHVRRHLLAGVITRDPSHPFGRVIGDLMVPLASGVGGKSLEPTSIAVQGGVHHFDLLHDAAVIDQVMAWLV